MGSNRAAGYLPKEELVSIYYIHIIGASQSEPHTNHDYVYEQIAVLIYTCVYVCTYVATRRPCVCHARTFAMHTIITLLSNQDARFDRKWQPLNLKLSKLEYDGNQHSAAVEER